MLGMKINPRLMFWEVTNMDQAGNLTAYDTILYFKGQRWSLIPALSNLFQLILFQDGQMTFGRLEKLLGQASAEDLAGLGDFLGEEPAGGITISLLRKILMRVLGMIEADTGEKPFIFTNTGFIEAVTRSGFVTPHMKELVLELGAPIHPNGGLCGNNCLHCFLANVAARFQEQFPGVRMEDYLMTPERWLEVAKWADQWSVLKIRLSGAPFGKHGWPATRAIAELAAEKAIDLHIHCEVTSFESWQADKLAEIMAGNLPTIHFSLEGSTAKINGLLRRPCSGSDDAFFQKIIMTMRKFAQKKFPILISTAVHTGNLGDLWPMYVLLKNEFGESWVEWVVYQLEKVGRMKENPELLPSPQQIHEASVAFLKQWLEDGDRKSPSVSLPSCGEINPDEKLIDPQNLFPVNDLSGLTAFPRDRRILVIDTFGGLKINGMQWMLFKHHHLWSQSGGWAKNLGERIAEIWGSLGFQQYKNIPLEWIKDCLSCPIAAWCRGGFEYSVVGNEHWDGEVTSMLLPDLQVCGITGISKGGSVDAHNIVEMKKILEG